MGFTKGHSTPSSLSISANALRNAAHCKSILRNAFSVAVVILSFSILAVAQTFTFGQFTERNGTNDFVFTNNVGNASFQTITTGSPVFFTYQNIEGLIPALQGPQAAHVFVTATTATPASQAAGSPPRDIQPFSGTFTIQVIRDAPAGVGTGTQRNLLTAVITPDGTAQSSLAGDDLSDAAAYTASDARQTIVYTSDFLTFGPGAVDNLTLGFTSLNPVLSIGIGGFLNSFSAAGTGSFATSILPTPVAIPTAAHVSVSGRVMTANGAGLRNAVVTIMDSSGVAKRTVTGTFGYYNFPDIEVGTAYTVSVSSKTYQFAPRIINVSEDVADFNFVPLSGLR